MGKLQKALLIFIPFWAYLGIYQLQYFAWDFALSQNWFTQNGLVLFKDVIYHHTQLPLFILLGMSKIMGNNFEMLRFSSFIMLNFLSLGIYLLGSRISRKIGIVSIIIFFLTFFPLFQNFNIEEMLASIFSLYSVYFYLRFLEKFKNLWLFSCGILVSLAIMSKQSVVLILIAFIIHFIWYFFANRLRVKDYIKGVSYFILGIFLGSLPFLVYYLLTNSLGDFLYWNIVFNYTIYPSLSTAYAIKDGINASLWMYVGLIPGLLILFDKKNKYRFELGLIILCTIFLSVSMLPSFLVYKILPFYPYPVILWAVLLSFANKKSVKAFLVIGVIFLLPILKNFYIDYLPANAFDSSYILDYGEDELRVVEWVKKNTNKDVKIMDLGNHYVLTLSQRLPANKYVYLFPWLIYPFDKSTKDILSNPPHVVIVDWRTFADFPVLNKWPFIEFVKKNYKLQAKFGTYEIYSFTK